MKRTFWCIPVFLLFCILSVKADVLGPYIMDSNVPDTQQDMDELCFRLVVYMFQLTRV